MGLAVVDFRDISIFAERNMVKSHKKSLETAKCDSRMLGLILLVETQTRLIHLLPSRFGDKSNQVIVFSV